MTKWRITKERIWIPSSESGYVRPGQFGHKAWSLYYGDKRVARYTRWELACQHIETAHRRFGL